MCGVGEEWVERLGKSRLGLGAGGDEAGSGWLGIALEVWSGCGESGSVGVGMAG